MKMCNVFGLDNGLYFPYYLTKDHTLYDLSNNVVAENVREYGVYYKISGVNRKPARIYNDQQ